jgi:predicted RNA binding protein YcfA (HicA-like mRNA interferase family)
MKVRDVLERLKQDGWVVERTRGDHPQLKHPAKPGLVTVSGHPSDEVPAGTLGDIWKQAGFGEQR